LQEKEMLDDFEQTVEQSNFDSLKHIRDSGVDNIRGSEVERDEPISGPEFK